MINLTFVVLIEANETGFLQNKRVIYKPKVQVWKQATPCICCIKCRGKLAGNWLSRWVVHRVLVHTLATAPHPPLCVRMSYLNLVEQIITKLKDK